MTGANLRTGRNGEGDFTVRQTLPRRLEVLGVRVQPCGNDPAVCQQFQGAALLRTVPRCGSPDCGQAFIAAEPPRGSRPGPRRCAKHIPLSERKYWKTTGPRATASLTHLQKKGCPCNRSKLYMLWSTVRSAGYTTSGPMASCSLGSRRTPTGAARRRRPISWGYSGYMDSPFQKIPSPMAPSTLVVVVSNRRPLAPASSVDNLLVVIVLPREWRETGLSSRFRECPKQRIPRDWAGTAGVLPLRYTATRGPQGPPQARPDTEGRSTLDQPCCWPTCHLWLVPRASHWAPGASLGNS